MLLFMEYGGEKSIASLLRIILLLTLQCYIDIFQVSDADAFTYQQELRKFASSLGLRHLEFLCPGTLAGIVCKDAQTLKEYYAQIQQTRNLLDGPFAQQVDTSEDENVQATSKHYNTALPKDQDPEALKAAMPKRGKVQVSY